MIRPAVLTADQIIALVKRERDRILDLQSDPKQDLVTNACKLQALNWVLDLPQTVAQERSQQASLKNTLSPL